MRKSLIIVSITVLIILSSLISSHDSSQHACTDSDNGKNRKISGEVQSSNWFFKTKHKDSCLNNKHIEYSCIDGKISRSVSLCPEGCNGPGTACNPSMMTLDPDKPLSNLLSESELGDELFIPEIKLKLKLEKHSDNEGCSLFSFGPLTLTPEIQGSGSASQGSGAPPALPPSPPFSNPDSEFKKCLPIEKFEIGSNDWATKLPPSLKEKAEKVQRSYQDYCNKEISGAKFSLSVCNTPKQDPNAKGFGPAFKLKIKFGK
ncbi:hypothetical protein FJZ18_02770 [Candidatus Pacearchaeota archaeon]|nr:hypothetical protein [Candidatus Pacearchaeota archaeon]